MSRERARARAVRDAEREVVRERAAKQQARQARLSSLRPTLPELPRRRRRYGAMPLRLQLGLGFGWLVTQWVCWQLFADPRTRVGLALVSLLAIPLVVVLLPRKGKP